MKRFRFTAQFFDGYIPYIPANNLPPFFLNFWWSKVWGGGLYDEQKRNIFFGIKILA